MENGVVYLVVWILLCIAVALLAKHWGKLFFSYFILSLFLTPLVGLVVLLIRGKATDEQRFDITPHLFYCRECGSTFSSTTDLWKGKCPECQGPTVETIITREEWGRKTKDEQEDLLRSFRNGMYLRTIRRSFDRPAVETSNDAAEQIAKYKHLLDNGAITQEEYESKKKQLLGL